MEHLMTLGHHVLFCLPVRVQLQAGVLLYELVAVSAEPCQVLPRKH